MTHAYSDLYIESAQQVLGDAFDFVANECEDDLSTFAVDFANSNVGVLFGRGAVRYVAGMNGAELANAVREEQGKSPYPNEPIFYLDKSPEYWVGWALAFYQWFSGRSFSQILRIISIHEFLCMYPTFHEMDIQQLIDECERRISSVEKIVV